MKSLKSTTPHDHRYCAENKPEVNESKRLASTFNNDNSALSGDEVMPSMRVKLQSEAAIEDNHQGAIKKDEGNSMQSSKNAYYGCDSYSMCRVVFNSKELLLDHIATKHNRSKPASKQTNSCIAAASTVPTSNHQILTQSQQRSKYTHACETTSEDEVLPSKSKKKRRIKETVELNPTINNGQYKRTKRSKLHCICKTKFDGTK